MTSERTPAGAPPEPESEPEIDLEEVIAGAKRDLERMIDLNPMVMLLVGSDGSILRANRALLTMLEREEFPDVLGSPVRDLFRCDDPELLSRLLSGGSYAEETGTARLPDGRVLALRFVYVESGGNDGQGVLMVADVTSDQARAEQLEKSLKTEAVRALAGALMHTINQPLTVIMVKARLMHAALEKQSIDTGELRNNLQQIMDLTLDISRTLSAAERPTDFVTADYYKSLRIMDLNQSNSGKGGDDARQDPTS